MCGKSTRLILGFIIAFSKFKLCRGGLWGNDLEDLFAWRTWDYALMSPSLKIPKAIFDSRAFAMTFQDVYPSLSLSLFFWYANIVIPITIYLYDILIYARYLHSYNRSRTCFSIITETVSGGKHTEAYSIAICRYVSTNLQRVCFHILNRSLRMHIIYFVFCTG